MRRNSSFLLGEMLVFVYLVAAGLTQTHVRSLRASERVRGVGLRNGTVFGRPQFGVISNAESARIIQMALKLHF